jgi:hypothetical protein
VVNGQVYDHDRCWRLARRASSYLTLHGESCITCLSVRSTASPYKSHINATHAFLSPQPTTTHRQSTCRARLLAQRVCVPRPCSNRPLALAALWRPPWLPSMMAQVRGMPGAHTDSTMGLDACAPRAHHLARMRSLHAGCRCHDPLPPHARTHAHRCHSTTSGNLSAGLWHRQGPQAHQAALPSLPRAALQRAARARVQPHVLRAMHPRDARLPCVRRRRGRPGGQHRAGGCVCLCVLVCVYVCERRGGACVRRVRHEAAVAAWQPA